ncbi:type II toxin-antitoxin system VapC family toxin [Phreatobacter sp.]|uniref:type II toxin-antitoxin system VapC family toxin n=1 Tax=Phreatobacter sp. TaxID=1966341 RepID=UPI003F6F822A
MATRFYCDANVFIMAVEGRAGHIGLSAELMTAAMDERCTLVTSLLTLGEVMVVPLRFNEGETLASYRDLLGGSYPGILVRPVDAATLGEAAALRARHPRLKLPDAIHLATAQLNRIDWFVTNDVRMTRDSGLRTATPFDPPLEAALARLPPVG